MESVLQKVADINRELVGASYTAMSVIGVDGELSEFITSGISTSVRRRIGKLPQERGVLGFVPLPL